MALTRYSNMVDGKVSYKWRSVKPYTSDSGICSSLLDYNRDEDFIDDAYTVIEKYKNNIEEQL